MEWVFFGQNRCECKHTTKDSAYQSNKFRTISVQLKIFISIIKLVQLNLLKCIGFNFSLFWPLPLIQPFFVVKCKLNCYNFHLIFFDFFFSSSTATASSSLTIDVSSSTHATNYCFFFLLRFAPQDVSEWHCFMSPCFF